MYHQRCTYTNAPPPYGIVRGKCRRGEPNATIVRSSTGRSVKVTDALPQYPDKREAPPESVLAFAELLRRSSRVVAFTGAGISTESGIPDYRGPGGVWSQGKPPTIADFLDSRDTRLAYWERRRTSYPEMVARQPNAGHLALSRLAEMGKLSVVITQNIDGLHQDSGLADDAVVELHGTARQVQCTSCGTRESGEAIHKRLLAGADHPDCLQCGGLLRSATVLFGEQLPREPLRRAVAEAQQCDLMVVIGSSLVVQPAAQLPLVAKHGGAALVFVNRESTQLDAHADVLVLGDAGHALTTALDLMEGTPDGP